MLNTLTGAEWGEQLLPMDGDELIDGRGGVDTVVYEHPRSAYTLRSIAGGGWSVTNILGLGGTDTLANVERLQFADTRVALDMSTNAGVVARVIGAVFGGEAVANREYVGIGLSLLDAGMDYAGLMQVALNARVGPGASNAQVVSVLYQSLYSHSPSSGFSAIYTRNTACRQASQACGR